MKCIEVREELIEAGAAPELATPEAQLHLAGCSSCSSEWKAMLQTMSLLDEWQAPEPSPYFSTRLRARVREQAQQPVGLAERLRSIFGGGFAAGRQAALATAMAALLLAGVVMFRTAGSSDGVHPLHNNEVAATEPGTPVADLQTLDKNFDIYANFDLLDDVAGSSNTGVSN